MAKLQVLAVLEAYQAGARACYTLLPVTANPYVAGTQLAAEWANGWYNMLADHPELELRQPYLLSSGKDEPHA